jgi:hypothetical protein
VTVEKFQIPNAKSQKKSKVVAGGEDRATFVFFDFRDFLAF